jgi:hypothetical protein
VNRNDRSEGEKIRSEETMDQRTVLDHQFTVAAYLVTWAIQLGYLTWLGLKWRAQKRAARRTLRNLR